MRHEIMDMPETKMCVEQAVEQEIQWNTFTFFIDDSYDIETSTFLCWTEAAEL